MASEIGVGVKTTPKLWGFETIYCNQPLYCGKKLTVYGGYCCSKHKHRIKTETFFVAEGSGVIWVDGNRHEVTPGCSIHVPPGTFHCFGSLSGLVLLEFSTYHDDADVERDPNLPSHLILPDEVELFRVHPKRGGGA